MSFLYFLPNAEHTMFKIGVSDVLDARLVSIGAQYDRDLARLCEIDREHVYRAERALHHAFKNYRRTASYRTGNTEWFDMIVYDAALGMASAMKGPLRINKTIDLVEYLEDRERTKLLQRLQSRDAAREYARSREETTGHYKQCTRIMRDLHYPHLISEPVATPGYSFSTGGWVRLYYAWLYAIHGRHAAPAILHAAYAAGVQEINKNIPQDNEVVLPPDGNEYSRESALQEYDRRRLYYSVEEQLSFAIRHLYQPNAGYWADVPSWVLDQYRIDQQLKAAA